MMQNPQPHPTNFVIIALLFDIKIEMLIVVI
jgi:hypothetical protein